MEYARPDALVSTDWLANRLDAPDIRVVDGSFYLPAAKRDPKAEFTNQHITGAVFFDIDEIADTSSSLPHMLPSPEKFSARVRKLGLGDGNKIIVYAYAAEDTEWWVLREANSHEEISFGFWPGSGTVREPAFYAYARPEPAGLAAAAIQPGNAYYSRELADFIIPYDAVRSAPSPDVVALDFFQSAYDAASDLGRWDRGALDRPRAEWP